MANISRPTRTSPLPPRIIPEGNSGLGPSPHARRVYQEPVEEAEAVATPDWALPSGADADTVTEPPDDDVPPITEDTETIEGAAVPEGSDVPEVTAEPVNPDEPETIEESSAVSGPGAEQIPDDLQAVHDTVHADIHAEQAALQAAELGEQPPAELAAANDDAHPEEQPPG